MTRPTFLGKTFTVTDESGLTSMDNALEFVANYPSVKTLLIHSSLYRELQKCNMVVYTTDPNIDALDKFSKRVLEERKVTVHNNVSLF